MPDCQTAKRPRQSLQNFSKILTLRLCMRAALLTGVILSRSNANERTVTFTATEHHVSRAGYSRFQFRRDFLCWRAHHRNLLPAYLLGQKACSRKRRFLSNCERSVARRVPAVPSLSSNGSGKAGSEVD